MVGTLDSILNFIVPLILIVVVGWIFYRALHLEEAYRRVSNWWENRQQDRDVQTQIKTIDYS